jgi:ABC-2 type transport system permease protein
MNMILVVMYREYLIRVTSSVWMFFDLVMPLIYLLLFGVGLDRAMSGGVAAGGAQLNYQSFFLGGVLSMACFGIAINTSYGFFVDRDNGIFYEFLTYPMTRGEFLIGKIIFNCSLAVIQSTITIVVSVLFLKIPIDWSMIGFALAGIVIGTAGWFFFLALLALRITRSDIYNTVLNIAYFVLMFASSMFYPIESMPAWLRYISLANPLTWHTDVLRYATIGIGNLDMIIMEAIAFGIFLLISFWFSVRSLQNVVMK